MKKVKIMLMALAILAIAGGALAFNVSKFNQWYCIISAQIDLHPPAGKPVFYCPNDTRWIGSKVCGDLFNVTIVVNPFVVSTQNVCTTPTNNMACALHQNCTSNTTVYADN